LALPPSGGAVTRILTRPPCHPAISILDARGTAHTLISTPSRWATTGRFSTLPRYRASKWRSAYADHPYHPTPMSERRDPSNPTTSFIRVGPNVDLPAMEEGVLDLWRRTNAFEESVSRRPADNEYIFYDGPPFPTGSPHFGNLLAGVIKDMVPRYWTMRGYRVERRFGWDTHGLPIEMDVENLHWSWGSGAQQRLGQKIDEAKLPGDHKSLLKQEVSKTAAFRSSFNSPS